MSVPAIGPIISSAMVAAIGTGDELAFLPSKAWTARLSVGIAGWRSSSWSDIVIPVGALAGKTHADSSPWRPIQLGGLFRGRREGSC